MTARSETASERVRAYEALVEIGQQLQAAEVDADAVFALIVARARELIETDVSWLGLVDENDRIFVKVAVGTQTFEFNEMNVRVGTGIGGRAVAEGRAVVVRNQAKYDVQMPPPVHRALAREGIVSIICAPMFHDGRAVGALYVGSRQLTDFSRRATVLLTALAAQAAIAIVNSSLYSRLSQQNELLERTFSLHRSLSNASLSGADVDEIVRTLAGLIGRDVALRTDDDDRWTMYPAAARNGREAGEFLESVHAVRIRAQGTELGSLGIVGVDEPTALQRNALQHGATVVALEMIKQRAALEVEGRLRGELLDELLQARGDWSEGLAGRCERFGVERDCEWHVTAFEPKRESQAAELRDLIRIAVGQGLAPGHALVTQRASKVIVALDAAAVDVGERTGLMLVKAERAGIPAIAGTGSARRELHIGLREAEAALGLARERDAPYLHARYDDLGPLKFMLDAPAATEMAALVEETVGPLAEYDARRKASLVETLRVYLECGEHQPTTAERCHIHVNTLKYRLKRAEAVLGKSLGDPRTRFELRLALAVADVLELYRLDHPAAAEHSSRRD
ncbi:MAG TPA: helix-turn-helix domain-containing protein [Thermoleophilaceae bacterium]|nr:helix-turn-helix domain-containing protein [Thermoleophilaceae bacterium]